jgi:hypothetical protein
MRRRSSTTSAHGSASREGPLVQTAAPRARIEPLSEARYKVQLTAGAELKAKLERACDLMRHRNPTGDLAPVIEAALELLLAKLERERLYLPRSRVADVPSFSSSQTGTRWGIRL